MLQHISSHTAVTSLIAKCTHADMCPHHTQLLNNPDFLMEMFQKRDIFARLLFLLTYNNVSQKKNLDLLDQTGSDTSFLGHPVCFGFIKLSHAQLRY